MKQWKLLHHDRLNGDTNQEQILDILCDNRGITADEQRGAFLEPHLDAATLTKAGLDAKAVAVAIQRIKRAIDTGEAITVYTDYDVDGVCAGTILWETLKRLGANVLPYIPHREREGYGLSRLGIEQIHKEQKTSLLITADHGITASEKIAFAKDLGMDTIVLDHHVAPDHLPDAVALVHTTSLCATGIAWIFAREVVQVLGRTNFNTDTTYLDLAALATIADLVPLTGINRLIVSHGLQELRQTQRIGLRAMFEEAGVVINDIDVYTVGHILAPRINAMGRVTHAIDALRLLCTHDSLRAKRLAQLLGSTNRERQLLTEEATEHALERAKKQFHSGAKLLFVYDVSYPQGVIGLVAGRLTQEFYRPSIVLSLGEEYSKASARSIAGCNIVEAIRTAEDLLINVGGHPMAAGFTVETKHIERLSQRLSAYLTKQLTEDLCIPTLAVDTAISFTVLTESFMKMIRKLSPFGVGNPQPVFASLSVQITQCKLVGRDGKHLKCVVRESGGRSMEAIGFGMGTMLSQLRADDTVDVAYTVDQNAWNGRTKLQLKLKDIRIPA